MRQYKLCIQRIIIIKKKKIKSKVKGDGWERVDSVKGKAIYFFLSSFLSHIYGNRTVDFCRSGRQSWSTRRELRVGTNILAFRQTSRGRKFSYLCYFSLKAM